MGCGALGRPGVFPDAEVLVVLLLLLITINNTIIPIINIITLITVVIFNYRSYPQSPSGTRALAGRRHKSWSSQLLYWLSWS